MNNRIIARELLKIAKILVSKETLKKQESFQRWDIYETKNEEYQLYVNKLSGNVDKVFKIDENNPLDYNEISSSKYPNWVKTKQFSLIS